MTVALPEDGHVSRQSLAILLLEQVLIVWQYKQLNAKQSEQFDENRAHGSVSMNTSAAQAVEFWE
jgi:hypothetical protein